MTEFSEFIGDGHEVMSSIDREGKRPSLIIADITADEAWILAPMRSTMVLKEWA